MDPTRMEHMGNKPNVQKKGGTSLEAGEWIRSVNLRSRTLGAYGQMTCSVHLHYGGESQWEVVIAWIFFKGKVHSGPPWKNARGINTDLMQAIAEAVERSEGQFQWRRNSATLDYPDWPDRFTIEEICRELKLLDLKA